LSQIDLPERGGAQWVLLDFSKGAELWERWPEPSKPDSESLFAVGSAYSPETVFEKTLRGSRTLFERYQLLGEGLAVDNQHLSDLLEQPYRNNDYRCPEDNCAKHSAGE
jgi:hypothetical protein